MNKLRILRFTAALRITAALLVLALASPAFAVNKDMVQLQTQIQQLQDAVARLQQSNDERMGVLKDLVQQSADSVNKLSLTVDGLQRQLATQQSAEGGKVDQVSGQVQAINDSLDEIKTRMNRMEKLLGDVQNQQQTITNNMQGGGGAQGGAATPSTAPLPPSSSLPPSAPLDTPSTRSAKPSAAVPATAPTAGPSASAEPIDQMYKSAYNDYMAAKYPVATSEFNDLIKSYPDNTLAGNAWYYLGEIDYRAGKYLAAEKSYDHLLEQFPDNNKIPAAHLHKGQALIALKENEAGIREWRTLIQRFPASPESAQARSKLSGMGIAIKPRT